MLVRSDRRYHFALPRADVWSMIDSVDEYRSWWPWLRRFDGRALSGGERWACTVQPPLPYPLHFTIELHEVRPADRVEAAVSGDIVGEARLVLADREPGCEVRLTSLLAPGNRALRVVASAARPVVRFGHDWVLDTGARQFADRALRPPGS